MDMQDCCPSLASSLEPLVHLRNIVSISLFYVYYFSNTKRWSTFFLINGMIFVFISRYYKDVYVNSFNLSTARPWNSLPIEFLPLTYDLNGFKSRINSHFLIVGYL